MRERFVQLSWSHVIASAVMRPLAISVGGYFLPPIIAPSLLLTYNMQCWGIICISCPPHYYLILPHIGDKQVAFVYTTPCSFSPIRSIKQGLNCGTFPPPKAISQNIMDYYHIIHPSIPVRIIYYIPRSVSLIITHRSSKNYRIFLRGAMSSRVLYDRL